MKTGQHRNINNAQYTKGAKNPEKQHATASVKVTGKRQAKKSVKNY